MDMGFANGPMIEKRVELVGHDDLYFVTVPYQNSGLPRCVLVDLEAGVDWSSLCLFVLCRV